MEEYFYLRNKQNHPVITVCKIETDRDRTGYGIALCSLKDNPCKKEGRKWSRKRALKAIGIMGASCPMTRNEAFNVINSLSKKMKIELSNLMLESCHKGLYHKSFYINTKLEEKL